MPRRLLINKKPSLASIGYSHQQLSRVPLGTANRHSQFHCPKSKISKVRILLGTCLVIRETQISKSRYIHSKQFSYLKNDL